VHPALSLVTSANCTLAGGDGLLSRWWAGKGKTGNDTSILHWPPSRADLEHADEALQDLLWHEQQQGPPPNVLTEQRSRKRRRWQPAAQQHTVNAQTPGEETGRLITPTEVCPTVQGR